MSVSNLDVRLYGGNGKRVTFPMNRIASVNFTLGERGGYLEGEVTIEGRWEEFSYIGVERVDVWENGALVYRGVVLTPRMDMNEAERVTLSTYGLVTRLDKLLVTKRFAYTTFTDVGQLFTDIANQFVILSDRLPSLVLDVSGVSGLGITLEDFDSKHKSVKDCFNLICDNSPNTLIWGFDVDGSGNDRLYLRPRSSTVSRVVAIGEGVSGFVYPLDAGQVVNRVYVDGGAATTANVAPNPSFEDPASVTDDQNNLLQNASFEQQTDSGSRQNAAYWNRANGAVRRQYPDDNPGSGNLSHTGNCYVEMTTTNATFDQVVQLGFPQPVTVSIWGRQNTNGDSEYFQIKAVERNSAGTVLNTLSSANLTPASNVYQWFSQVFTPTNAATTQLDIQFVMLSAGGYGHGVILDDARVTLNSVQANCWGVGTNLNAVFSTLDWQSRDWAYDGIQSVKVVPNILVAGGYVEICTLPQNRVDVKPGTTYYFTAWLYGSSGTITLGWREYADGVLTSTLVMPSGESVTAFGGGSRHQFSFTSGTTTNKIEPFVRFYDSSGNPVYLDAVMITAGAAPALGVFYEASQFQAVRSVTDYLVGDIGAGAAASITTYGLREKRESVEQVTNVATLDMYCKAYFKAFGTPVVQGEITLEDPSVNFGLEGTIRLVNLPNAPSALFPSKVSYRYHAGLQVRIQLNNELPTLAQLLKNMAKSNALLGSSGGGSGSGGGGGGSYPSAAGVTSLNGATGATNVLPGAGMESVVSGGDTTLAVKLSRSFLFRG